MSFLFNRSQGGRRNSLQTLFLFLIFLSLFLSPHSPGLAQEKSPAKKGGDVKAVETKTAKKLRVVTKLFSPFVMKKGEKLEGFSIDLLKELAAQGKFEYELYVVKTIGELLDEVRSGRADFAIAAISMTHEREKTLDFSYPIFDSGFHILIPLEQSHQGISSVFSTIFFTILSPEILYLLGFILLLILFAAHALWFLERKKNPDIPENYLHGIWESFWWAAVTITTVGYGDRVPHRGWGKLLGLVWMFIGICVIAYFTATLTTRLTLQELRGSINGPKDLPGKYVGTVEKSTAHSYLKKNNIRNKTYPVIENAYQDLKKGVIDAIVYDAPALLYHSSHQGQGVFRVVGPMFHPEKYAIAFPPKSGKIELINRALLQLMSLGKYQKINKKWFNAEGN